MTINEILRLKESEHKVEFKEAISGNFSFNGGGKIKPSDRRRCILGYVIALANEGGGCLIFGVKEGNPNVVVGSSQSIGKIGELESKIYNDTGIRVQAEEIFDFNKKRVLVLKIPSRPKGKVYKYEDVPLMRTGDELKPMSDEYHLKIIQEQEEDFSQKICQGVSLNDLDNDAVQKMKVAYSKKQNNNQFLTLSKKQVLIDLDLMIDDKITNAAVILLGKEKIIKANIPQSLIRLEYRKNESQINFDNRYDFRGPFFIEVENLWNTIDLRNGTIPIQNDSFIFDIPFFNKEVVREAINNAIAHRNYSISSEIVIKQSSTQLIIVSPGGFPIGVTLQNLLDIPSTPRNRLLTDILEKTGIVERSGQGVDKIYYQTLKDGKREPDYTNSDDFFVDLRLSALIEDKAFALFIESTQQDLKDNDKLSVHEVITLNNIRKGNKESNFKKNIIKKLLDRKLIEMRGKTKGVNYVLSKSYYEFSNEKGKYSKITLDKEQIFVIILQHLQRFKQAKMQDFVDLFEGRLTRRQVKFNIEKLVEGRELKRNGIGSGTYYTVGENFAEAMKLFSEAVEIGFKKLKEDGKI